MLVSNVMKLTVIKLADSFSPTAHLINFVDEVIDDINRELNSTFPTFTEAVGGDFTVDVDYNFFPDEYIRNVVVIGAAAKWFEQDEEGLDMAQSYTMRYKENMFYMVRDYITKVPDSYRADQTGYYEAKAHLERGVFLLIDWEDIP